MLTKTDCVNFVKKHLRIFFRDITSLGSAYFYGLVLLLVLAFGMFALLLYLKNIDSEEGSDKLNSFQAFDLRKSSKGHLE